MSCLEPAPAAARHLSEVAVATGLSAHDQALAAVREIAAETGAASLKLRPRIIG